MYIAWLIAGIIFLILDYKKRNIYNLVFAASCLFCSISAQKIENNYTIQFVLFFVFSIVFYTLIKEVFKKETIEKQQLKTLKNYKNQIAIVTKDIGKTLSIDGLGQVEFNGQKWSAKSTSDNEIKAGNKVKIVSLENTILNVEEMSNAEN